MTPEFPAHFACNYQCLLNRLKLHGMPDSYPEKWVVDVKNVGTGEKALVYLGRYLYRGVIRGKRHSRL